MSLRCSRNIIEQTISELRRAGSRGTEGVVFWLTSRTGDRATVTHVYVPEYAAQADYFTIPPEGMRQLMRDLRGMHLALAAQVHSHPREAFHSCADDRWAVVRHVGALSIVVPYFGRTIDADNFNSVAAFFQLSRDDKWNPVEQAAALHIQ